MFHPLLSSCMRVFLLLIAERFKTTNALYATCMERLIETALLNAIRTVSKGKVFVIVSSGASVHFCWTFCQRISGFGNILNKILVHWVYLFLSKMEVTYMGHI